MEHHSPGYWDVNYLEGRDYPNVSTLLLHRMHDEATLQGRMNGTRALELGCGTGDFARQLARLGFDVTAVDMSPVAIEQAKKTVAEVGFIEYRLADVERFQPKGRFDLITMKLVFAFMKDKPGMLKRIRKMLKPKRGAFILIAPILVAGETYNEHIATISDHQVELERMLNETFGTVRLYSEQYFGPNGIAAHYLIYP